MDDDERFAKLMEQAGVVPLGDRRDVGTRRQAHAQVVQQRERDDEAEFIEAMETMDRVMDKDVGAMTDAPRKVSLVRFRPRERVHIEASLDLHGLTEAQALRRVSAFVPKAFTDGCRLVAIIVGKGLHSRNGVSVLRPAVEQWLRLDGDPFIEEFGDAPRAHGGSGVLLIRLRRKRRN